jgi:hypothetical protein
LALPARDPSIHDESGPHRDQGADGGEDEIGKVLPEGARALVRDRRAAPTSTIHLGRSVHSCDGEVLVRGEGGAGSALGEAVASRDPPGAGDANGGCSSRNGGAVNVNRPPRRKAVGRTGGGRPRSGGDGNPRDLRRSTLPQDRGIPPSYSGFATD